jgi:hypothetical protein
MQAKTGSPMRMGSSNLQNESGAGDDSTEPSTPALVKSESSETVSRPPVPKPRNHARQGSAATLSPSTSNPSLSSNSGGGSSSGSGSGGNTPNIGKREVREDDNPFGSFEAVVMSLDEMAELGGTSSAGGVTGASGAGGESQRLYVRDPKERVPLTMREDPKKYERAIWAFELLLSHYDYFFGVRKHYLHFFILLFTKFVLY